MSTAICTTTPPCKKLQANHGGDNNFVFGPAEYSDLFRRHKMTDADKEFAKNFLKYFASFVKTGTYLLVLNDRLEIMLKISFKILRKFIFIFLNVLATLTARILFGSGSELPLKNSLEIIWVDLLIILY
jgi:hypothetical protein